MVELDLNKMWDDFVEKLQYSEPALRDVISECKRCLIDPKIFHSNIFLLSGHINFYPETGLLEPTENLQELIRFLPPAYPLPFAAAFPDVIVWYMNAYDDEFYNSNPYFVEIKNNTSKYFNEETGKQNGSFLRMIVIAYGKENPYECRININPENNNKEENKIQSVLPLTTIITQQIKSELSSLKNTDPPFNRDLS